MTSTPNRCSRCGRENDPKFAFCLDCGQPLAAEKPAPAAGACPTCGAPVQPGFRFCGICGKPVAPPQAPTPRHGSVASAPAAAPPLPGPTPRAARIRLALVRNDGVPGPILAVEKDEALCGRTEGDLLLPDDPTVSPRHARFSVAGGVLRVEDLGSVNGTFIRLKEPRPLAVGDEFRVGRQLLRLEPLARPPRSEDPGAARPWGTKDLGCRFRLSQLLEGGGLGEIFPLRDGENQLGREAGEVTFPGDRYVSARHARLDVGEGVTLADTGSSNGTYVKIAGSAELAIGDQLLVGAQLLRVE